MEQEILAVCLCTIRCPYYPNNNLPDLLFSDHKLLLRVLQNLQITTENDKNVGSFLILCSYIKRTLYEYPHLIQNNLLMNFLDRVKNRKDNEPDLRLAAPAENKSGYIPANNRKFIWLRPARRDVSIKTVEERLHRTAASLTASIL